MAITWNNIAAPNFGAANELFKQAQDNLLNVGATLTATAKGYQDAIRKRNLGLIQEYVNSAKSPEELQSEGFQAGLAKLTGGMGGEYDTLAKAQLVDKAYDSLLSRKANQVSIDTNQFNLDTGRKNQLTKEYTNKILAAPVEQRDALRQAAIDAGAFDFAGVTAGDLAVAQLLGTTQQNKLRDATWDDQVKAFKLANDKLIAETKDIKTNNDIAWYNALTQRAQAEAAAAKAEAERKAKQNEKNPALLLLSGIDKIDAAYNSDLLKPSGDPKVADSLETWWDGKNTWWRSDTDLDNIKTILSTDPKTAKLPGKMQVAIADIAYNTLMNENTLGRNTFNIGGAREQAEEAIKAAFDKVETQKNDYLYSQKIPLYRDAVRQQMIQTGTRDPVQAARDVGMNEYEMYRTNIRTPLQSMAESLYESSGSTLPKEQFVDKFIYKSVNKEPVDDLIKPKQEAASVPAQSSSSFLNKLGTSSPAEAVALINEQLKQTNDPIQIAFLENELRKAEQSKPVKQATTTTTTAPQGKSGTPLQQIALPPNVNKLISTPLDIATNPSTIKTKPVADPLRQAALEQPPVATNNTSQPRQLPPAEIAQGERMEQAALSRLIGAKLKEKQAEVQKQFPDTPLKQLAKAATPVPSPLIPVESQNAYKVKENNLVLDFRTGKSTPTKDPVPMPNVEWDKPVEVVKINPIFAQLPQYKVVVTYVGDADTFLAKSNKYTTKGRENESSNIECRIDSIDAPETPHPEYGKRGQPYGEEAAKILQQMVLNKEISIRVTKPTDGASNYGRDICQIEIAGKDVSVELIREGAAWAYQYKDKRTGEDYNHYGSAGVRLEQEARDAKKGLWALPNPQNPFDFRQQEKKRQRGY